MLELRRLLSTRSAMSAQSSMAQEKEQLTQTTSDKTFVQIGKGYCAEIFTQPGANKVLKRVYPGQERALYNDFRCHLALQEAKNNLGKLDLHDLDVLIPRVKAYVGPNCSFWKEFESSFSVTDRTAERRHIIVSQRIDPLDEQIRVLLIATYCSPEQRDQAINNPANAACLARLYLGRRSSSRYPAQFSLRNFELTLDRIEKLELGAVILNLAKRIAQGLALIHWGAKCDARDVEFVLGTAPISMSLSSSDYPREGPITYTDEVNKLKQREIHVWVLDFNQCEEIPLDEADCEKAAKAHWDNDPYYPRPDRTSKEDQALWDSFAMEYIRVGMKLLNGQSRLPEMYLDAVQKECKRRFPNGPPSGAPPPQRLAAPPSSSLDNENASITTLPSHSSKKKASGRARPGNIDLESLQE